jgi:signal peptidase I
VIAFNNPAGSDTPLDRKKILISRLVGLPGDTVMVWDKQLHINRKPVPPPVMARTEYRVITNGKAIGDDFLTEYRIEKPRMIADIGIYDFDLSPEAHASIEKHPDVKTIRPTKLYPSDNREGYYPPSSFFRWNRDQYGPLVVPAKGASISLEIKNVDLYRDIIEVHEGHELIVDFQGVTLDGLLVTEYTFEKDYCFVMDDNRDNPKDSRKIGFIPMDHVLGVSNRVLWNGRKSYDYLKNLQPDRILKRIR